MNWFQDLGFSREEALVQAIALFNSKEDLLLAEPVSGIKAVYGFLQTNCVQNPYFVTSRPGYLADTTREYLKRVLDVNEHSQIKSQEQGSALSPEFKTAKIAELKIDFHFEDSDEQALDIVTNTDAKVILVPQPWNRKYLPTHPNIIFARDYDNKPPVLRAFRALLTHLLN